MQRDKIKNYRQLEKDRRKNTLKALMYSVFRKRRVVARREKDRETGFYVDSYKPSILFVSLGIIIFCVADAFFTLEIIKYGGRELNPLMDLLISKDYRIFLLVKFALTAVCLMIIIIHNNFRLFKFFYGYHFLFILFSVYSLLVSYELIILR